MLSPQAGLTSETVPATLSSSSSSSESSLSQSPAAEKTSAAALNKEDNDKNNEVQEQQQEQPPSATFRYATYSSRLAQLKELEERQLRLQQMCEAALQENELTSNNNNNNSNNNANSVVKTNTVLTAPTMENEEASQPYESPSSFFTSQANATKQTSALSRPFTTIIPAPGKDETTLHEDLLTGEVQSFRDAASYTRLSSINSNNSEYNGDGGMNINKHESLPSLSSSELPSPSYGLQGNNAFTSLQTKYNSKSNYFSTNNDINNNYTTTDCNSNKRRTIPAPAPELSRTNPVLTKPYHYSTKQAPPPPPPLAAPMKTEQYPATMESSNPHNTLNDLENKFSTLRSNWRNKARPSTKHTRQVQHPLHSATHIDKALVSPRSEATNANTTLQKDNYYSTNETNNNNTAHDSTIENTINKWVTPLHAARVANSRSASPFNKFESSSGIVYTPLPTPASHYNYAGSSGGDNNIVEPKQGDELDKNGSTTHYRVAPLSPASVELDKHITPGHYSNRQFSNINKSNDNDKGDNNGKYQTNIKNNISPFWPLPAPTRSSLPPPPESQESSISTLLGKTHKRVSLPNRSSLREKYMPHKQSRRNSIHERKAKHILVSPSTSDAARVHVTHITSPPIDVVSPFRTSVRSVPVAHRESEKVFEKLPPSTRQSRQNAKFASPPPPPMESEDENLQMYGNFINKRNVSQDNSDNSDDYNDESSAIDTVRKLRNQLNRSVLRARYSDHLHKDEAMPAAPKSNVESVPKSNKQHKQLAHEQRRSRQSRKTSRLSDVWATDEPSNRQRATSIVGNDEEEQETSSSSESTPEYNLEYKKRNNSVARPKKKNDEGKQKNNEEHTKYDRQHGENKAKNKENRREDRERQSKRTGNTKKVATRDRNRKNGNHPYNNIDDFITDSSHISERTTTSSHASSSSYERTNSIATTSSSESFSSSSSELSSESYSEERSKDKLRKHNKSHTHHKSKGKSRNENDRAYRKAHEESKTEHENKKYKMDNKKERRKSKSRRLSSDRNPQTNSRQNNSEINYNNSAINTSRYFSDTETAKAKAKAEALARHLAKSITEKKKLNENVHDLQQDLDDCNDEIARLHRIIERHSAKMESRSALLKELEAKEEEVQLYELKMKRLQRMLAQSEQHPWEKEEESESEEECSEEQEERETETEKQKMSTEQKNYRNNKDSNTKVNNTRRKSKNVNATPTKAKVLPTQNKQKNSPTRSNITTTTTNNAEDRRKMEEEKCQLAEELTMAMEQIRVLDGKLTEMERNAAASRLREVQSQYKHNKNNHRQANQRREEKITKAKEKEMGRRAMSINMEDKLEEEKGHASAECEPLTLTTSLASSSLAPSTTHSLPSAPSEKIILRPLPEQGDKLIESLIESNEQAIHQSVVQETEFKDQLRRYEVIVNALHHSLRDCLNSLEVQDDEVNELEEINTHLRSKSKEQVEQLSNIKAEATNISKSITTSRSEAEKVLSLANNVQDANSAYNKTSNVASFNIQNKKCHDGATQNLAPLTVQFVQKAMHDFTLLAKFLRDLREMSVDDEDSDNSDSNKGKKSKIDHDERNKLRAELFKEVDQCVQESEYALQQLQKVKKNNINNNNNKKRNKRIADGGSKSSCNSDFIVENNANNNDNVHRALFHDDNNDKDDVNVDTKRHEMITPPEEQSLFTEELSVPDHFDADVDETQRVDSAVQHNYRENKLPSTHKKREVEQVFTKEELSEEEMEIDSTIPSPLPPPPPLPQKLNLSRQHFPLHTKEKMEIDKISKATVGIINSQHKDDNDNAVAWNDNRESEWQSHSSSCKEEEEEQLPEVSSKYDLEKEIEKIQEVPITHSLRELEKEKKCKEESLPHKAHKESPEKQEEYDVHRHNHLHILSPTSQTENTVMPHETHNVNHKEEGFTNHESSISPSPVRPEVCDHHLPSQQAMHYYPPQQNRFATALPINKPCESLMREDISSDVSKENDQHDLWHHEEQKKQTDVLHDKIHATPFSPILSPPPPLSLLQSDEEEVNGQLFAHDEAKHLRDKRSTEIVQKHNEEEKEKEKEKEKKEEKEHGKLVHINEVLEEEGLHKLPENVNTSLAKVNEGDEIWENKKNEKYNNVNDSDKNDVTIPFIDALHEPTISKSSSNSERHDKIDHARDVSHISHNRGNNNNVDDDDNNNNYCISGPDAYNNIAVDNVSVSSPTITENNSYSSSSGKNHFSNFRPYHQEHKEHHNDANMTTNNVHTNNTEREMSAKDESALPKLKQEEEYLVNRNSHHVLHKEPCTNKAEDKTHTEEIKLTERSDLEKVRSEKREEQEQKLKARLHPRTIAAADDNNGNDDKKEKYHVLDTAETLASSSLASSSFVSTTAEQEEQEKFKPQEQQLLPEQNKKEDDIKCGVDIDDNLMQEDFDDYKDNETKENYDKCPSNSDSSSFTWRTTTAATTSHPDSEPSASVAHSTLTPSHTFLHTPTVNSIDERHIVNKEINDVDIIPHASHKDEQTHNGKIGKQSGSINSEWEEEEKKKANEKVEKSINDNSLSDNKDVNLTSLQIPSELITVAECVESTHSDPVSVTVSRTTPNITIAPSTLPTESAHSLLPSESSLPAHEHHTSFTAQEHLNKQQYVDKQKNADVEQIHRTHSTPREVAIEELTQDKIDNNTNTKSNNITIDVKANVKSSNENEDENNNKYKIHNIQHNNTRDKLIAMSAHDSKDSVLNSARSQVSSLLPHSAERCESTPMPSSLAPQPEPPISPMSSSYSTSRPREQYIISREHSPETKGQQSKMPEQQQEQQQEEVLESEYKNKNYNIKQKHESTSPKGKIHADHAIDHDETNANKKSNNSNAVESITPINSATNTFVNTPHNIRENCELGKATSERASARQKSPSTRAQSFTRTNSSTSLSSNHVTYRENKAAMMRRELNESKHKTGVPRINAGIHKARSLLAHSTNTPTAQLIRSTSSSSPIINMENVQNTQQKQSDNTNKNIKTKLTKEHEGLEETNVEKGASITSKVLSNSESLQQKKLSKVPLSTSLNTDEHDNNVDKVKENVSLSHSPQITPVKQVNAKLSDLPISPKNEQPMLMEQEEKVQYTSESVDSSPEPRALNVEMHTPRLHSTSSRHSYMESPLMKVKVSPVSATNKSFMHPYTIVTTSLDQADESNSNLNDCKYKWSKAGSVPSSQFSRKSSLRSSEIPEYVYARMPANRHARSTTRSHSSYSPEEGTEESPDALHRVKEQTSTSVAKNINDNNVGNVNKAKHGKVDNEVEPQECPTHGPLTKNGKTVKEEHENLQREQEATTSHTNSSRPLNVAMKTSARFATSLSSTSLSSSSSPSSLASVHKKSHSPRRPVMQKTSTLHNKTSLHEPFTHQELLEEEEEKLTHQSKEDCTAASSRSHAKSTSLSAREPPNPKRSTAEFTGFVHDEEIGTGHDERLSTTPPAQHVRMNSTKRQSISTDGSGSSHQASMPMERISVRSTENSPLNTYNTITISPLTTSPSISPMRRSMSMQRSPTQLKTAAIPTIKTTPCNTESENKNLSNNTTNNDSRSKEEVWRARHASPSPRSIKEETLTSKQTPSRKSLSNHNANTTTTPSPSSIARKPMYTVHSTPVNSNASAHKPNNVVDVPDSTLTSLRQPLSPQSPATSARKAEVEKILQRLRAKRVDSARRRQQYEKK